MAEICNEGDSFPLLAMFLAAAAGTTLLLFVAPSLTNWLLQIVCFFDLTGVGYREIICSFADCVGMWFGATFLRAPSNGWL